MHPLRLPSFDVQLTTSCGKPYIFDPLRKKKVRLTPEEWVRQHLVHYLTHHLGYPRTLIKIEATQPIPAASRPRRADILVHDQRHGTPLMVIECKAATQPLQPLGLTQLTQYNTVFRAPFLTLTNGLHHVSYRLHPTQPTYTRLPDIPPFHTLT